jgi:hypothetical protein
MIRFRPHSIGELMTKPQSMDLSLLNAEEQAVYKKTKRTDEEKALVEEFWTRGLSQGAKSALTDYAKEMLYGYSKKVSSKEMDKGIQCEQASIDLYNRVYFTRHVKHVGRVQDEYLSGECDILVPGAVTKDVKTSWNVDTFPVLSSDCHDPMYEWQGRAYMRLYGTKRHEVAFCLVDTPDDLIPRWEQVDLHKVEHINPALRVTRIVYEHCPVLEAKMISKIKLAQKYLGELVSRINAEHNITPDWKKQFL